MPTSSPIEVLLRKFNYIYLSSGINYVLADLELEKVSGNKSAT